MLEAIVLLMYGLAAVRLEFGLTLDSEQSSTHSVKNDSFVFVMLWEVVLLMYGLAAGRFDEEIGRRTVFVWG